MLRVFHLSHKPPFPLKDGGCVAIHSILKLLLLTNKTEVFHFTLGTQKHPYRKNAYPESWQEKAFIDGHFINTRTNIFDALKFLLKKESYNIKRFEKESVKEILTNYLDNMRFDIAIFESIYVLPYLDIFKERGIKVVVRTHNIEYKLWEDRAKNARSGLKKWYYKKLAEQLQKYELTQLQKVEGIMAITEEDANFFKQHLKLPKITVIPPSMHSKYPKADYNLDDFYFLGAMDWKPNKEGIEWLFQEVIPHGLERSTLYIAGKGLKENQFRHPTVKTEGEVKNALNFITNHGICIIPLRSGGGVKIKLLENMAMGKPIITTSEGIRGVDVSHGKEVLIADDPKEFKKLMTTLQTDKKLRKELGENARKFIQNNYSETKLTQKLFAYLNDV